MASSATRAETVADKLRTAIKRGLYMGGERLVEQSLATQMTVSQNTIRDALKILEGEGWVLKTARYGVHVRSFSAQEAEELYALWAAVETLALRWAIQTLNKSGLMQLRRLILEARKYALTGDTDQSTETLFALHRMIATLGNHPQTSEILTILHNRAYLLEIVRRNRAPRSLHSHQAQILFFEKLISLMETGDADGASDLLAYLIRSEGETLSQVLSAGY